jgi:hypothetical protein
VLLTAMEVLEASELTVSVRNLRYGAVVSDRVERLPTEARRDTGRRR